MEEAVHLTADLFVPGKWMVESIPWLRFIPSWAPGAGFQRKAANIKEKMKEIDEIGFNWAKEQIVRMSWRLRLHLLLMLFSFYQQSGDYIESFTSKGLQQEDGEPLNADDEDTVKWCSAALYPGGAITVSNPAVARCRS